MSIVHYWRFSTSIHFLPVHFSEIIPHPESEMLRIVGPDSPFSHRTRTFFRSPFRASEKVQQNTLAKAFLCVWHTRKFESPAINVRIIGTFRKWSLYYCSLVSLLSNREKIKTPMCMQNESSYIPKPTSRVRKEIFTWIPRNQMQMATELRNYPIYSITHAGYVGKSQKWLRPHYFPCTRAVRPPLWNRTRGSYVYL